MLTDIHQEDFFLTCIHQTAWCGTTNANFVIKLSNQPKQHQIHTMTMVPFSPSYVETVPFYTVRQTADPEQEGRAALKLNCGFFFSTRNVIFT
jgi:hypothetical protein